MNRAATTILREMQTAHRAGNLKTSDFYGYGDRIAATLNDQELIQAHDMFQAAYDEDNNNTAVMALAVSMSVAHLNRCRDEVRKSTTAEILDHWATLPPYRTASWADRHIHNAHGDVLEERFPGVEDLITDNWTDAEDEDTDTTNARYRDWQIISYRTAAEEANVPA